jgi:hypothetical protein
LRTGSFAFETCGVRSSAYERPLHLARRTLDTSRQFLSINSVDHVSGGIAQNEDSQ